MSVRSLVVVLLVCLVSWLVAASTVIYTINRSKQERDILVTVVCQDVLLREEHGDPHAAEYRRRYTIVLAEIGERCPPRKEIP